MDIVHSCCPNKCDIHAPRFILQETMKLAKGDLIQLACEACKTVIMVMVKPDDERIEV